MMISWDPPSLIILIILILSIISLHRIDTPNTAEGRPRLNFFLIVCPCTTK